MALCATRSGLAGGDLNRSYVEYVTGERELCDLANDTHQLRNLASGSDYTAERDRFDAWLDAFRACSRPEEQSKTNPLVEDLAK